MGSSLSQLEQQPAPAAATPPATSPPPTSPPTMSPLATSPPATSCRKKKSEQASFLEDLKDHIDEFVNASMDEHKTCFKKTMQKMFSMSKIVGSKSSNTKEVESTLPLQTTVAK